MEFWETVMNKIGVELYKKEKEKIIDKKMDFQLQLLMTGKVKNYPIPKGNKKE